MFKRSLGVAASATAVIAVVAAAPALGATKVVPDDHNDALPRFDITRATFNNGDQGLSGKAHGQPHPLQRHVDLAARS